MEKSKIELDYTKPISKTREELFETICSFDTEALLCKVKWKPRSVGETYWYINLGNVFCDRWTGKPVDWYCYNMRNCFATRDDGLYELEKQKVYVDLKDFADRYNKGIDWCNINTEKYCLFYNYRTDSICIDVDNSDKFTTIYFTSEEIAKTAIKTIGEDRLKKYYFEVIS